MLKPKKTVWAALEMRQIGKQKAGNNRELDVLNTMWNTMLNTMLNPIKRVWADLGVRRIGGQKAGNGGVVKTHRTGA